MNNGLIIISPFLLEPLKRLNFKYFLEYLDCLNLEDKSKFCYLNHEAINKILYELNEIIIINAEKHELSLSSLLYLSLAISSSPNIINYTYSIDFILLIKNYIQEENNIFRKIILSKLNMIIIDNYEQLGYYKNEDQIIINDIKIFNNSIIKNNIKELIEYNLCFIFDGIQEKNINEIYIQLINELIRTIKFDNYLNVFNIIFGLDLENINIAKIMEEKLNQLLCYDLNYIQQFIISKLEDLFNTEKINFYFFVLKYILKYSFYLNSISIVSNTKTYISQIFQNSENIDKLLSFKFNDIDVKKRMEYILKTLLDYDDYIKYFNSINEKLNKILVYYENYSLNSINDIKLIKKIIDTKEGNYEKYTEYYDNNKKIIDRIFIIWKINKERGLNIDKNKLKNQLNNYIYFLIDNIFQRSFFKLILNNNFFKIEIASISIIDFENNEINFDLLKKLINDKNTIHHRKLKESFNKLLLFFDEIKERAINEYKITKLNMILFIFTESENDYDYNDNISCIYSIKDGIYYKDENILNNKTFSQNKGFIYLMKSKTLNNINYNTNNYNNNIKKDKNLNNSNNNNDRTKLNSGQNISEKEKGKNAINLENQYIILYREKKIILCEQNEMSEFEFKKINFINVMKFNSNSNNIRLIAYDDKKIYLLEKKINSKNTNLELQISNSIEIYCSFLLVNDYYLIIIQNSDIIFCKKNDLFQKENKNNNNAKNDLFKEKRQNNIINKNDQFKGAIVNNDNLIIFTQNQNIKRNYKLLLFNIKREIIAGKEIVINSNYLNEFSFDITKLCMINNSLVCLTYKNKSNNYGLLFIKIGDYNSENKLFFYGTNSFNIICFYPPELLKQKFDNYKDYLLVGGAQNGAGRLVFLKLIFDNNDQIVEIKEMKCSEFDGPIDNIISFEEKKNILYACSYGNIYFNKEFNLEF